MSDYEFSISQIIFYNLKQASARSQTYCNFSADLFITYYLDMVFLKHWTLQIPQVQTAFDPFNKMILT